MDPKLKLAMEAMQLAAELTPVILAAIHNIQAAHANGATVEQLLAAADSAYDSVMAQAQAELSK